MSLIRYTCRDCGEKFEVDVTPVIPAKTFGPPEHCYPEDGGEIDPDECPKCGVKVDAGECYRIAERDEREREVEIALAEMDYQ